MSNESQQNFDNITPLFSNCMPDNDAMKNNRVMIPKSRSDLWLVTSINIYHPLRGCPKRDNYRPSYLTCMTHVRHVGLKWVTHRFCYTTYVFIKILHMKKEHCIRKYITYESKNIAYKTLHMTINQSRPINITDFKGTSILFDNQKQKLYQ
jgi:hypothetical protein